MLGKVWFFNFTGSDDDDDNKTCTCTEFQKVLDDEAKAVGMKNKTIKNKSKNGPASTTWTSLCRKIRGPQWIKTEIRRVREETLELRRHVIMSEDRISSYPCCQVAPSGILCVVGVNFILLALILYGVERSMVT